MRIALLAAFVISCATPASPRLSAVPAPAGAGAPCPATVADSRITPPPTITDRAQSWRGNDVLWVVLPPEGVLRGNAMKIPAYRLVPGAIEMRGRRTDGPAPDVRWTPPSSYGNAGFQATMVTFPTAGCWEVTYVLAGQELRFVLDVKLPHRDPLLSFADGEAEFLVALASRGMVIEEVLRDEKLRYALDAPDGRLIQTNRGWITFVWFTDRASVASCEVAPGHEYRLTRGQRQGTLSSTAPLHFLATDRMVAVTPAEELRLPIWEALGKPDTPIC